MKGDQNPQAGHPWPQIASPSAPQKMDRGEQDPMACHMPLQAAVSQSSLTHLLGCTEYSQGGALPPAINRAHTLCKACRCPSEQGALRATGDFHVPGVEGMQHASLQPRMQLGSGSGGSSKAQLQAMAPNLCLYKQAIFSHLWLMCHFNHIQETWLLKPCIQKFHWIKNPLPS